MMSAFFVCELQIELNGIVKNTPYLCIYLRRFSKHMANIFNNLFKKKSVQVVADVIADKEIPVKNTAGVDISVWNGIIKPYVCGNNMMELYRNIPEVHWAVNFIVERIANANYILRNAQDDTIVWNNDQFNQFLAHPNALQSFRELVKSHWVNRLVTGNAFMRACLGEGISGDERIRWCTNWWVLPSAYTQIIPAKMYGLPMYGIATQEELIKCYRLDCKKMGREDIRPVEIWHDRDGVFEFESTNTGGYLRSRSRLASLEKPMSNLISVYEARNVIYTKRGALGIIVGKRRDETGDVPLTSKDIHDVEQSWTRNYGVDGSQFPFAFSNVDLGFVKTSGSIDDMKPFDETLADAIQIAGAFGIPADLVPRKDQSTFSNQQASEKAVYTGTIIPLTDTYCKELTAFLGLDKQGLYIDATFDKVDCLQSGAKDREEVLKLKNERYKDEFNNGLVTLNDWRSAIGEDKIEHAIFNKLKFEMSQAELDMVAQVIGGQANAPQNAKETANNE